jgi:hypothetical protein
MEGKLQKYTHRSFLGNTWQERTFACRGAELCYFAAGDGGGGVTKGAAPVKTIDLRTVASVRRLLNLREFHLQYGDAKKAPYRLRAASTDLATRWVEVLRARLGAPGKSHAPGTPLTGSSKSGGGVDSGGESGSTSSNRPRPDTKKNAPAVDAGGADQKDLAVMSFFAAAGIMHNDAAATTNPTIPPAAAAAAAATAHSKAVTFTTDTIGAAERHRTQHTAPDTPAMARMQPLRQSSNASAASALESKHATGATIPSSITEGDIHSHLRFAEDPLARSDLPWMNGAACRTEGFLTKRGGKRKTWKRRWFRVTAKTLFYYASASSATPLGTVSLHGATVRASTHDKYEHCFELVPSSAVQSSFPRFARTIAMYAHSDKEKREWLESLERAVLTPTQAIAMASGYVGKDRSLHFTAGHPSGQRSGAGDPTTVVAAEVAEAAEATRNASGEALSPWESTRAPLRDAGRGGGSGDNHGGTAQSSVTFQASDFALPPATIRQHRAALGRSQSAVPSSPTTTRRVGGRARASVINLENEDDVWDYSETDETQVLERKMEAIELARRRAALRVTQSKKKKRRHVRASARKKNAVHRRSERKVARARKRAQKRVQAKVRQHRRGGSGGDPLWNAPETKDGSSAVVAMMALDAATHEPMRSSISLAPPVTGSRRIRSNIRSTELARFELNDRMMFAGSFGGEGPPNTPNNSSKSRVCGRGTPYLELMSTARFGRTLRPTLPSSSRKTATRKKSYSQEAKASMNRGMPHLYGTRVLQSRQAHVTGTVKGGIFYHGHPADHVAPLQYSKMEDNTAFNVLSHCAVDPMTPPSQALHPLTRTRLRLQNEKDRREEESAFLDGVDVTREYQRQTHRMLASPARVDLNAVSGLGGGAGDPEIRGGAGGGAGMPAGVARRSAGGCGRAANKTGRALSPGRAKLRLADLVSDDHPRRGHPVSVAAAYAPSPPRAMRQMSTDDTDAAIQILETSIRQLDARLSHPQGVLAPLSLGDSAHREPTLSATSVQSRLNVPTFLVMFDNADRAPALNPSAEEGRGGGGGGGGAGVVSATAGLAGMKSEPRPSFASVARLRVDTGNNHGSSTLRMRATAVHHKETYERGMSPALCRACSVYLDSNVCPPSGRRTSSGLAVEITERVSAATSGSTAEENVVAKVPLIRHLDPRAGWKGMVMAAWELQERTLEFVEEDEAAVVVSGIAGGGGGGDDDDDDDAGVGSNISRTVPRHPITLTVVPETAEKDGAPWPNGDEGGQRHVSDLVHRKTDNRKSRRRHGHRRLPQASLDALSGGDKNIFKHVAGSYSKRR